MCGRYVARLQAAQLAEWDLIRNVPEFESYNVAPTQSVPVVRHMPEGNVVDLVHWGLIPFWAKGVPPKYSTINATVEKIQDGATWRGPWKRGQRCALLANGFYEWQVLEDGKTKQPYYIHLNDQELFGFAGLWDSSTREDGTVVQSCTIVTLPASPFMARIHNARQRMPAILAKEDRKAWLEGSAEEAFSVLRPYPDEHLVAWPVSTRVNTPRNNVADLVKPLKEGKG